MKRRSILIVEDEIDIREVLAERLKMHSQNFNIVIAVDGREAIQKVNLQAFDCIITDLNMPKVTGEEFIKAARDGRENKSTPIIIVTGHPNENLLAMHDFVWLLQKPADTEKLLMMVDQQILLGNSSGRLPAQLINLLVWGLTEVFDRMKAPVEGLQPISRDKLISLSGDWLVVMEIKFHEKKFWFLIGFENSVVKDLFSMRNKNIEAVVKDLITTTNTYEGLRDSVLLTEKIILKRDMLTPEKLAGYTGLTLPFQVEQGQIWIHSLSNQVFIF
jgi:two-component system, chemotaxis family, chemotaxis protein CheY